MLALKFSLLVFSVLFAYVLGYILTETKYRLSQFNVFKMKAFECRKCFTFHISWVTSTFISLLFYDWVMFIIGIAFAIMLFIGLYIDEKNKTIKI